MAVFGKQYEPVWPDLIGSGRVQEVTTSLSQRVYHRLLDGALWPQRGGV